MTPNQISAPEHPMEVEMIFEHLKIGENKIEENDRHITEVFEEDESSFVGDNYNNKAWDGIK